MKNYMIWAIKFIKEGIVVGTIIYIVLLIGLLLKKERRHLGIHNLYEMLLCVWSVTVILITGLLPLNLQLNTLDDFGMNFNIIPFIGGSFIPMVLNTAMFVPLGILLPLVFRKKINWKKIVLVGGGFSLVIEMTQLFEGRYAEIDDLILNTLGAVIGYNILNCIFMVKQNKKRAIYKSGMLVVSLLVVFGLIWLICDHNVEQIDGIESVNIKIEKIDILHNGDRITLDKDSYEFRLFCTQLSNCADHIIDIEDVNDSDIVDKNDYCVEVSFKQPVTIWFQNNKEFYMTDIDRILYDTNTNYIFWGKNGYQMSLDYTKLGETLQKYREQILQEYKQLNILVKRYCE